MSQTPHILIVDDDPKIRKGLAAFLTDQGLRASIASNGRELDDKLATSKVDLVVLDIMMPGEDGLSILRRLQATNRTPVILLTALVAEADRIVGLEIGAEDYVCKPFSPRELLARIRVALRRNDPDDGDRKQSRGSQFVFDGWCLDARARTLTSPSGGYVDLTTGEFELLLALAEHPNKLLSRDQLLDLTRGHDALAIDRAIDVQVMRLRRKIEIDPQMPSLIKTVRNGGYIFTPHVKVVAGEGER